jgi:protein-disulfide isomerase
MPGVPVTFPNVARPLATLVALAAVLQAQGEGLASRSKGRPDAPVTIYEMSDFQCPYCRHFALETLPELERQYLTGGAVRLVYINFPLPALHPNATAAAELAICAARLGKFWPVHDRLFARQSVWAALHSPTAYFLALGDSLGVNRTALTRCLESPATRAAVDADVAAATKAGARSTPTFYVEGVLIEGDAPAGVFRTLLDSIYQSKAAPPSGR